MTIPSDLLDRFDREIRYKRPDKGLLARILQWAMPKDPGALYVPPRVAYAIVTARGSVWRFLPIAALLMAFTVGLTVLLLQVPFLRPSAVGLLTQLFGLFLPQGWAAGLAWGVGICVVIGLGPLVERSDFQRMLDNQPASKSGIYNAWLRLALWEEVAFRAGCEKWTWLERIRASMVFGAIHIINIWYSFAAGVALSLTGFGFLLVYLWDYRRTRNQVSATAYSGVVHAVYNTLAMSLILVLVVVSILLRFV